MGIWLYKLHNVQSHHSTYHLRALITDKYIKHHSQILPSKSRMRNQNALDRSNGTPRSSNPSICRSSKRKHLSIDHITSTLPTRAKPHDPNWYWQPEQPFSSPTIPPEHAHQQ